MTTEDDDAMHSTCRLLIATLALLCAGTASAIDTDRDDVRAFIDEMVEQHGFDRAELVVLLGEAEVQEGILEAMRRPAERTKPWHEYRDIFIQPKRVKAGVAFWAEHADAIERIRAAIVACYGERTVSLQQLAATFRRGDLLELL